MGQQRLILGILIILVIHFDTVSAAVKNVTCACDGETAIVDITHLTCYVNETDGKIANIYGCTCVEDDYWLLATNTSTGRYDISCVELTTTTTTTTTTALTTTTTPEAPFIGSCGVVKATGTKATISKILLYLGGIWVILWTIATIIVNIVCKSGGQHRVLYIIQELALIALFIFLGFFTTNPFKSDTACKVTTIILHFLITFILALCATQALFAKSIIGGSSAKNGSIHIIINIGIPVILGLVVSLVSYFMAKKYYNLGLHCFITVMSDQLWAFVIPTWILLVFSVFIGQLGFLACKKAQNDVDEGQFFWALKTCKSMPMFSLFLVTCFYLAAFGLDFQKLWLLILFLVVSLIFGPLVFVTHTFNFEPTATKIWARMKIPFYTPCPIEEVPTPRPITPEPEESPPEDAPPEDKAGESPQEKKEVPKQEAPGPQQPLPPGAVPPPGPGQPRPPMQPPKKYSNDPTGSQSFYDWLTDRNTSNIHASEDVLFKPKAF